MFQGLKKKIQHGSKAEQRLAGDGERGELSLLGVLGNNFTWIFFPLTEHTNGFSLSRPLGSNIHENRLGFSISGKKPAGHFYQRRTRHKQKWQLLHSRMEKNQREKVQSVKIEDKREERRRGRARRTSRFIHSSFEFQRVRGSLKNNDVWGGLCKFCCLNSDKNLLGHCIETQRVEVISIHGNLEVNANNRLRAGYPSVPLGAFQLFDQSICSEVRSYGNAIPPNTRECHNSDPESGPTGRNIH